MFQTFPIPETDWHHLNAQTPFGIPSFERPLITSIAEGFSLGSGTPTFTRATTAYQTDFEGRLILVPANAARMQGVRLEQTVVNTTSEDWTNAAWTKTIGTVTATTLTSTGANQTVLQSYTAAAANWVMRIRMSRITGTGNIDLTLDGGATWTTVTLTGSPQIFSIAQTAVTNPQYGIRIVTSGDAINADQIAVYNTTGKTNTNPPEYIAATYESGLGTPGAILGWRAFDTLNGNTVVSNVVTEATGAHIDSSQAAAAGGVTAGVVDASGPLGYLAEIVRTNDILQSNTLGTTWTISDAANMNAVSADQYVSTDGTTTMDKLQPKATTAVHSLDQAFTFTAAKYTFAANLRYVPATPQRWVALILNDGTTTWGASFDLLNGVVGAVSAGATSTIKATALANVYRVSVTNTANAAAAAGTVKISLNATDTATLESAARAGTETLGVGMVQHEIGISASSPIITTTIAVTRNADILGYVKSGNILDATGSIYTEVMIPSWDSVNEHRIISSQGAGSGIPLTLHTNPSLYIYDGTYRANTPFTVSGSVQKLASSWDGTTTVVANGGTIATGGFDGNLNMDDASFFVGAHGTGASAINGTIRNVRIWPRALSNAHLTRLTT